MSVRIENLVTSGTFSLDGGTWDVDNNVWIVGNDDECVIIDSPHDASAIIKQVGDRKVLAILLTHAHNDHIGAAREVADSVGAPIYLNPEDLVLWEQVYPDTQAGPGTGTTETSSRWPV
jgi:glyoxylase-like metal-dependent hydrolase (beta-lactamase superfamily II)